MPSPAVTKPVVEEEFDLLAFWIQHKKKVLMFLLLLVIGLLIFAIFQFVQYREREAAARDFSTAKTVEEYRRVVAAHPGSAVAGNALILIGDKLRAENKLDESTAALKEFTARLIHAPLTSG